MIWVLLVTGLLAHATMLWLHFTRMWSAEHFQYFPVALIAAGYLATQQRHQLGLLDKKFKSTNSLNKSKSTGNPWVTFAALMTVFLFLVIAVVLNLALTGWFAFLLFLAAIIYAGHSWLGLRIMLPVFILLLVIKPLPGFTEQSVTIGMQKIASNLASQMLDLMGIVHSKQGIVIHLATKSFMAEEACSGIRSLFSSITAIVFWGFMFRYPLIRHLLNVAQTIAWVLVWNAIRIAIVVAIEDRAHFSLASGLAHDALGLLIFFVIFGMVLSTDQLLGSAMDRVSLDDADERDESNESGAIEPQFALTEFLKWPYSKSYAIALSVCFCVLAFVSFRLLFLIPDYKDSFAAGELSPPTETDLSSEIRGWKTQSFEHIHREQDYLQGRDSYVWRLMRSESEVLLSIDGTFAEFHDLAWCYSSLGWNCDSDRNYTSIQDVANGVIDPTGEYSIIRLSKLTGETGIVLFTSLDQNGQIVVPPPMLGRETGVFVWQSFNNALRYVFGLNAEEGLRATTFVPPVSNIQLVYYPASQVSDSELQEITELFLDAREILRKSPRFQRAIGR
jgi:exosortase